MVDIEHPEALRRYLHQTGRIGVDEKPRFHILTGGVSNRTVWVERPNGEAWVLKQALEKLRVPIDWFSSPERIHREAMGLRWLARLAPSGATPPLIFEDHQEHILAMAAVPQPHHNWKSMLLEGQVRVDHVEQFARLLGTIHRQAAAQRDEIAASFADRSFFESLRLEPYYNYTATQVPEAADFLHNLIAETRTTRLTLVHGDYSPKNILVYQERLILLDHEVIHFGDPAFDLGFSLTHLLSKAHHLSGRRSALAKAADHYWQTYLTALGEVPWRDRLTPRAVRHTLGCLLARVAGRSQLEYFDNSKRNRQRQAVLPLLHDPPQTIPELTDRFIKGVGQSQ